MKFDWQIIPSMNKVKAGMLGKLKVLKPKASLLVPFIALFLGFNSQVSYAAITPSRSQMDSRVQYVEYNPEQVVRIKAAIGAVTTIVFAKGEQAKHFGSGFSAGWELQARDNYMFLKPRDKEADTNITIITNQDRIYNLEVSLTENKAQATYLLNFTYRDVEEQIRQSRLQEQRRKAILEQSYATNLAKADWNFMYRARGRDLLTDTGKAIKPVFVADDGRFTFMRFKSTSQMPSIFIVEDGEERVINSHMQDDYLVIHSVNPVYHLRYGDTVIAVDNKSYHKRSEKDKGHRQSFTTVPEISRTFR